MSKLRDRLKRSRGSIDGFSNLVDECLRSVAQKSRALANVQDSVWIESHQPGAGCVGSDRVIRKHDLSQRTRSAAERAVTFHGYDAVRDNEVVVNGGAQIKDALLDASPMENSVPNPVYSPVESLAACSHTSWIDNRELYNALRSNAELKRSSIQLLAACGSAGVMRDVTHNLDQTVEWSLKFKSRQGESFSTERVIAFASRDASAKIADAVAREMAPARGDDLLVADAFPRRTQPETITPRTLHVELMPPELEVHLIMDNYATRKTPAIQRWLVKHPRFHVHFTPTSASWLNLVERWFATLTEKQIRRGSFRSTRGTGNGNPRFPGPPQH